MIVQSHVQSHTSTPTTPRAKVEKNFTTPRYPREDIVHVDDFLTMRQSVLDEMYKAAICPPLSALDGPCRGRMLSISDLGYERFFASKIRNFASSRIFPWKGKTFNSLSETRGEGINRALSNRWPLHLYTFQTSIAHSLSDAKDTFVLDYDVPENPGFIRRIRDEIRQVSPNVFLGQAWMNVGGTHRFVLYFGLQTPE